MVNHRHRIVLMLCLAVVLLACSAKYSPQSVRSKVPLQWPYEPTPAKVTYVEALHGFTSGSGGRSALRVFTGSPAKENDLFALPVALAVSHDGRIAVADMGKRCVHLFIPDKNSYKRLSGHNRESIKTPVGLAFDNESRLFVSDSSGMILSFDRNGTYLFAIKNSDVGPLSRPTGLTYSPLKNLLYSVDTLKNQVNVFDRDGKFSFSFGKRGEKEGEFNFPTHIYRSNDGKIYVSDSLNFRVQIFDESGAFLGMFGNHGDGSGDLAMPKGVAADNDGNIYLVDSLFDNVQLFGAHGEFLLTVGRRGTNAGEFWLPSGLFINQNILYVCDTYNHRIQIFQITERYSAS